METALISCLLPSVSCRRLNCPDECRIPKEPEKDPEVVVLIVHPFIPEILLNVSSLTTADPLPELSLQFVFLTWSLNH
jgi:hypothetical protein